MAINRTSPKKGKVVDIPTAPTIGTATAGPESATVEFTAATKGGPATTYTALSNPGSITGTGTSSPITVSGLTAETAYTFTVRGNNATGSSEYSSASNSITTLVATSYESIATISVGSGGSSSVEFTSIPSTYKHLQIRAISKASGTPSATNFNLVHMQFNGDTGSNYSTHRVEVDGSTVSASASPNYSFINGSIHSGSTQGANVFGVSIIDISQYANTSIYKTTKSIGGADNNGSGIIGALSGNWRSTSAVTSIKLYPQANSFVQYSHFALYGIKG